MIGLARMVPVTADEYTEEDQTSCEATLLFWYVGTGQEVAAGDDLAEIETAKAVVVVKAPADGTLAEMLIEEGGAVQPGQTLALISSSE